MASALLIASYFYSLLTVAGIFVALVKVNIQGGVA